MRKSKPPVPLPLFSFMVADASETESAEIVDTLLHDLPQEHGGKKVRVKVHEGEGCNFYWVDGLGADAVRTGGHDRVFVRAAARRGDGAAAESDRGGAGGVSRLGGEDRR